ncbi:hypothetical protein TRVL_07699 [Trypanosoma vivax]|nr:hypothetical protein TRVL_07699 [Trypanosoma vivax]
MLLLLLVRRNSVFKALLLSLPNSSATPDISTTARHGTETHDTRQALQWCLAPEHCAPCIHNHAPSSLHLQSIGFGIQVPTYWSRDLQEMTACFCHAGIQRRYKLTFCLTTWRDVHRRNALGKSL